MSTVLGEHFSRLYVRFLIIIFFCISDHLLLPQVEGEPAELEGPGALDQTGQEGQSEMLQQVGVIVYI